MSKPEPASIPWFQRYMRLGNAGVTPTVTPSAYLPSRVELAQFFGPKHKSGFTFDNHGNDAYERYIRELYTRVLQQPWPLSGVLPFHFARGVLAEAMGLEVNWAEFAFKATHPHQSHGPHPRVLEDYGNIEDPLPPLEKVSPGPEFQVLLVGTLTHRWIRTWEVAYMCSFRPCVPCHMQSHRSH